MRARGKKDAEADDCKKKFLQFFNLVIIIVIIVDDDERKKKANVPRRLTLSFLSELEICLVSRRQLVPVYRCSLVSSILKLKLARSIGGKILSILRANLV